MNLFQETSLGESVSVFLKKPKATCDFPEAPDPLSPSGSAHELKVFSNIYFFSNEKIQG